MPSLTRLNNFALGGASNLEFATQVLESNVNISTLGISGEFESTSITLSLPEAGKYNLKFNLFVLISGSAQFDNM